ncbi:MAG: hypothetical protein KDI48_16250, partial [Xanthomonadales bacterium]|nr:hypothetical protein [Xanthomonadales bacterium]
GSTTATQNVNVHNVAPTTALSGADSVDEGSSYSLSVGAVQDPGTDTISAYSIDWGDGTVENYTVAQWAAAAGSFSHTYADGAASPTIVVSATDEDGSHVLGSKAISVANVAPELVINGAADTDEGAAYSLAIAGSDVAGAADPLSYSIDWGDGSAVQVLTAAELAALGGTVQHIFADDEDGPVNSTGRTISVTVSDGDGGSTTATQNVNVHNVAPDIALAGAGTATAGVAYVLNLGAVNDPGQDTVTEYIVDWGDGNVQSYASGGDVSHVYAAAGAQTISVSLVDEDGTHAGGTLNLDVEAPELTTVRIGDAPPRQGGTGGQWLEAWTDPAVLAIEHKANVADANESWTAATFAGGYFSLLSGIDIYQGDLGVSGQTQATSTVKQELDGTEALRFTLAEEATAVSVNLARFQLNDDGSLMAEAGLLRLIDANGQVVGEQAFQASGTGGQQLVQASAAQAFVAVEIWAGAYDGNDFVFGAYVAPDGSTVAPYEAGGKMHGSEFTLDWLEFSFPVVLGATDTLLQDPLGP